MLTPMHDGPRRGRRRLRSDPAAIRRRIAARRWRERQRLAAGRPSAFDSKAEARDLAALEKALSREEARDAAHRWRLERRKALRRYGPGFDLEVDPLDDLEEDDGRSCPQYSIHHRRGRPRLGRPRQEAGSEPDKAPKLHHELEPAGPEITARQRVGVAPRDARGRDQGHEGVTDGSPG